MTDCHCKHGIDIREAICQKCGFGELDHPCFMCGGLKFIRITAGPDDWSDELCPNCSISIRHCNCADPENCTQAVPGYVCKAGRTIWQDSQSSTPGGKHGS